MTNHLSVRLKHRQQIFIKSSLSLLLFTFTTLLFFSAGAFAQTQESVESNPIGKSELNRQKKTWAFQTDVMMVMWYGRYLGGEVSYSINPNLLIHFGGGVRSLDLVSETIESSSATTNEVSTSLQYFMGNTFYVNSGLLYANRTFESTVIGNQAVYSKNQVQLYTEGTYLKLGLGNRWNWKNFFLGIEWVGTMIPISVNILGEKMASNSAYSESKKRLQSEKDEVTKFSVLNLMTVGLGFAF